MGAGDLGGVTWNNNKVNAYTDCLDSDWWALTLSDFVRVTGSITKPTWLSDVYGGAGQEFQWAQNATNGVDGIVYPFQVGVRRRNTQSGATALTA
jgi:hypothetical protein